MEKEIRYIITFSYKSKRQNIFKCGRSFKTELEAEKIAAMYAGTQGLRVEEVIREKVEHD